MHTKYGGNDSSSSSSESDEEDNVNDNFDKAFLKTLSFLKNKDPRIYDKEVNFFADTSVVGESSQKLTKNKSEKPLYIKDYERNLILNKAQCYNESEEKNEEEHLHLE